MAFPSGARLTSLTTPAAAAAQRARMQEPQQRQAEMVKWSPSMRSNSWMPSSLELIGADAGDHRRPGRREIGVEKVVREARMVRRAISTARTARLRRAPQRRRMKLMGVAAQELELARAAARSAGLSNSRVPSASVWSAPSTSRPGLARPPRVAFARASRSATVARRAWRRRAPRPPARRCRPLTSIGMPAAASTARRLALREASTSGSCGDATAAIAASAHDIGSRRRSASSDMAAAVSSIERRVTSIIGHCAWRTAGARADLLGDRLAVDVLVVVPMRLEAEQPVLPDLHDPLRACEQPDHQRLRRDPRPAAPAGCPAPAEYLRS